MAALVYQWKHGWIPLTHEAAMPKTKGNEKAAHTLMQGVSRDHLRRSSHITAVAKGSRVALRDEHTGHTVSIDSGHAASFHSQGHTITAVHVGSFTTRSDHGWTATYGTDGRRIEPTGHEAGFGEADNTSAALRRKVAISKMSDAELADGMARYNNGQTRRFIAAEQLRRTEAARVVTPAAGRRSGGAPLDMGGLNALAGVSKDVKAKMAVSVAESNAKGLTEGIRKAPVGATVELHYPGSGHATVGKVIRHTPNGDPVLEIPGRATPFYGDKRYITKIVKRAT